MKMNAATAEQAQVWVTHWVNSPWPVDANVLEGQMGKIGWFRRADGRWEPGVSLEGQYLSVTGVENEHGLNTISWNLTDVVLESSEARDVSMNDAYTGYVSVLSSKFGKPKRKRAKNSLSCRWDLPNGCRVEVSNEFECVVVTINSPHYAEVLRYHERR